MPRPRVTKRPEPAKWDSSDDRKLFERNCRVFAQIAAQEGDHRAFVVARTLMISLLMDRVVPRWGWRNTGEWLGAAAVAMIRVAEKNEEAKGRK